MLDWAPLNIRVDQFYFAELDQLHSAASTRVSH